MRRILTCVLSLSLLACLAGPATAQTYTITQNAGTPFTDITATGTARLSFQDDSLTSAVPLGFNFTIYGTTYTSVVMSSNGNLQFGGTASSGFTNTNLTTTNTI